MHLLIAQETLFRDQHYLINHNTDGISWVRETFTDKITNIYIVETASPPKKKVLKFLLSYLYYSVFIKLIFNTNY
jgi:hypothetical protein